MKIHITIAGYNGAQHGIAMVDSNGNQYFLTVNHDGEYVFYDVDWNEYDPIKISAV